LAGLVHNGSMKKLTLPQFNAIIDGRSLKPRLKADLRFVTYTENLSDEEWNDRELLAIADRNNAKGVLLVSLDEEFYVIPYEFKSGITSSTTGRSQSIICDFCQTWQYGDKAGSISFPKSRTETVSYICCADLKCSMHVRTITPASKVSRAQLREDITPEQRIERLKLRLKRFLSALPYEPIRTDQ
jgi:hypothetical protein